MLIVAIKAHAVTDNGNGTFSIELPCKELSREEEAVLSRLFPHLEHELGKLLSKEALLASLATEADLSARVPELPPQPKRKL
jgi:hypothetical protein